MNADELRAVSHEMTAVVPKESGLLFCAFVYDADADQISYRSNAATEDLPGILRRLADRIASGAYEAHTDM